MATFRSRLPHAVHDSIGTALVEAARLPAAQAHAASEAARSAFVDAMRVTFPFAAVVVLGAAFIAWRWLPARAEPEPTLEDATDDEAIAEARGKLDGFDVANA